MCFGPKFAHPEESSDHSITMQNYDLDAVFDKWMTDYHVPVANKDHWRNAIHIEVTDALSKTNPAETWGDFGDRHMRIRPDFLNPGVIAHEQAHNAYALLSEAEKTQFINELISLLQHDDMVKFLYKKKSREIHGDVVEGHAEIYRYLEVPDVIKQYYPKLFA